MKRTHRRVFRTTLARLRTLEVGESFVAFRSNEMVVPAGLAGTAPVATNDQIIFVLGDFRGDVWIMNLEGGQS